MVSCHLSEWSASLSAGTQRDRAAEWSFLCQPGQRTVGAALAPLSPSIAGSVDRYTVSPPLPPGLVLDGSSGILSGTPTEARSVAPYTITADSLAGTARFVLVLTVSRRGQEPRRGKTRRPQRDSDPLIHLRGRGVRGPRGGELCAQVTMQSCPWTQSPGSLTARVASPRKACATLRASSGSIRQMPSCRIRLVSARERHRVHWTQVTSVDCALHQLQSSLSGSRLPEIVFP